VQAVLREARRIHAEWRAKSTAGGRASASKRAQPNLNLGSTKPGTSGVPLVEPCLKPLRDVTKRYDKTVTTAERSTLSGATPEETSSGENTFMEDVSQALRLFSPKSAEKELANWGGWWRNRYRESPDKARRVLAEIRSLIMERKIRKNPGAAATDLWNRLP
jgi:hypothetical protein